MNGDKIRQYTVRIECTIDSILSQKDLEARLVVALHDVEQGYTKLDGVDDDLKVTDYQLTEAAETCPRCDGILVPRVFDIDGRNLIERNVCKECGYGTPALI